MIRFRNTLRVMGFMLLINGAATITGQNARIKFDTDRIIGEVDKNLYGNFVKHLGRCV